MIEKWKRWYFPIREFEHGRLYPLLGIRLFKRYLPTSGDLVSRLRGVKRINSLKAGGRHAALVGYAEQAWRWEYRHLISALLLQAWALIGGLFVNAEQFWVSSIINLVVNVYPIMLQRYNRARIAAVLADETRLHDSSKPTPLRGAA